MNIFRGKLFTLDTGFAGGLIPYLMSVFYILQLRNKKFYYGTTGDLRRRLFDHLHGRVRYTRWNRPFRLVYFEFHQTSAQARERERLFKNHGVRRKALLRMISEFDKKLLLPFAPACVQGK
jgi:putative endonuclease